MSRPAVATAALLVLFGLSVLAVKVGVYGLPLTPSDARGVWQVELRIHVRGDGRRGRVTATLPTSGAGQVVFDEASSSDRLVFSIRGEDDQRVGVWSGWLGGIHEIVYRFRVQTLPASTPERAPGDLAEVPPEVQQAYLPPTPSHPASDAAVQQQLDRFELPGPDEPMARARLLYSFVTHEIAQVPTAGDDALLTLARREGSALGEARLLVTLLRGLGIPARSVRGLALREGEAPGEEVWSEAWLEGRWVPMSTQRGFFGERPPDLVALGSGEREVVEASSVQAVGHRLRALRERLRPDEIATVMAPSNRVLAAFSLYGLPLGTQSVLRALLLLPLGALMVAIFRNGIGVPTYGTFMPVLIAFAIRDFSLPAGLGLVTVVLGIGVLGRLPLERLRLLLVPRLGVLLCLVVLTVTGIALVGRGFGNRELFAGVLFPIVILTMLIERVSITLAEEGVRIALARAVASVAVAVAIYPVFRSPLAEHLVFTFPELVVSTMGALVWIGGYTGYRVADLLRFRALAVSEGPAS